jgi:superfamily II DNA/RNA helicase
LKGLIGDFLTFASLGIDKDIVEALETKGITMPFPIQQEAIPLALTGQDIIGQAKTGTGKTFGFGLPLIQSLGFEPTLGAKALVVVPTRELAIQVAEDLVLACSNRPTKVATLVGGRAYEGQISDIEAGAQIIVGTPGRIIDLSKQKKLDLSHIRFMVLDEADEMLDLGFLPDVERLFAYTPADRQTMLFSATMPGSIVSLARKYQNRPVHIRVNDPDEGHTKADIKQVVYRAHNMDKDEVVGRILQAEGRGKTVIFCKTKRQAAKVSEEMIDRGFNASALHGDMSQEARERSMAAFRSGKKDILVATEVAARGIDVDDVTHVINYTIPEDEKAYLHRTGRTGRAGRTGIAVTFVDWEDLTRWKNINQMLELGIEEPVETYSSSKHLFEDLGIPAGTKGRIKASAWPDGIRPRTDDAPGRPGAGNRGGSGGRGGSANRAPRDGARGGARDGAAKAAPREGGHTKPAHGDGEHKRPPVDRQRRRTRGGSQS